MVINEHIHAAPLFLHNHALNALPFLLMTFIFKISSETKNGHRHLESLGRKKGHFSRDNLNK
jgi:hypothetical protein